jgi:Protein of unknown function (DUF3225)
VDVNLPEVVAEIAAVFEAYEEALVAGDADRLDSAFWDSALTVRYGVAECLYGAGAIAAWRREAPPIPPGRRLGPTAISTFGRDLACVSTEFRNGDRPAVGRQSQTWVRFEDGWRVVAAHVSLLLPPAR